MENKLVVLCDCSWPEHQTIFTINGDPDPKWAYISIETHLTTYKNLFQRIWVAVKYVFGYRSQYGEWDDVSINHQEAKRIRDFMDKFLTENKLNQEDADG